MMSSNVNNRLIKLATLLAIIAHSSSELTIPEGAVPIVPTIPVLSGDSAVPAAGGAAAADKPAEAQANDPSQVKLQEAPADFNDHNVTGKAPRRKDLSEQIGVTASTVMPGTGLFDGNEFETDAVEVEAFAIDPTAVTNRQFAGFVRGTKYKTDAEKFHWSWVRDIDVSDEVKQAMKKQKQIAEMQADYHKAGVDKFWTAVIGAAWDKPFGQGSSLMGKLDHPVVHISYNDAAAYCNWAGRRMPTEMEWELAAKAELNKTSTPFPWGDSPTPPGKPMVNVAGEEDGFKTTAPVKSFKPNSLGAHNMVGNVWEWVNETFAEAKAGPAKHVLKGGSYVSKLGKEMLKNANLASRQGLALDSGFADIGFRCAGAPKSLVDSVIDSVSGWFGN
jgi:formylglycine-generating enzyme required for sulfatase activity